MNIKDDEAMGFTKPSEVKEEQPHATAAAAASVGTGGAAAAGVTLKGTPFDEVLRHYAQHRLGFTPTNAANFLSQLVKQRKFSSPRLIDALREDPRFRSLCSDMVKFARAGEVEVEELVGGAWSLANLSVHLPQLREVMVKLVRENGERLSPHGLSNYLWIISKDPTRASEEEKRLALELARIATAKLGEFNQAELASMLWGLAKQRVCHPPLLSAAKERVTQKFGSFKSQHQAIIAWSFATLRSPAPALFSLLLQLPEDKVRGFRPQELSMMCWAFGTLGVNPGNLFKHVSKVAHPIVGTFTPQGLSMLMWSFGKLGVKDEALFKRICEVAEKDLGRYSPAAMGAIVWTLSETKCASPGLLLEVEKTFLANPQTFFALELASLARALAVFGVARQETFFAIEKRILEPHMEKDGTESTLLRSLPTDGLVYIAWSFSRAGVRSERLLRAVSEAASERVEDLSSKQIAELLRPFGELQAQPEDLVTKISTMLESKEKKLEDFKPTQLADIAWSLAVTEANAPRLFSLIGQQVFQNFDQFSSTELSTLSWAFEVTGSEPDLASLIVAMSQDSQTG